jgi:hypothetical protein
MRIKGESKTRRVWLDNKEIFPEESQSLINHSPDGFNWGYRGSGPSQLALAILLEVTDRQTALKFYQKFKWEYVSNWQGDFDIDLDIPSYVKSLRNQERNTNGQLS